MNAAPEREVPWAMFLRHFSPTELIDEAKVVSHFVVAPSPYCRLCDSRFDGTPSAHVERHRRELKTYQTRSRRQSNAALEEAREAALSERRQVRADAVAEAAAGNHTLDEVAARYDVKVATLKSWMRDASKVEEPEGVAP
jgi:hypothetical protein